MIGKVVSQRRVFESAPGQMVPPRVKFLGTFLHTIPPFVETQWFRENNCQYIIRGFLTVKHYLATDQSLVA